MWAGKHGFNKIFEFLTGVQQTQVDLYTGSGRKTVVFSLGYIEDDML